MALFAIISAVVFVSRGGLKNPVTDLTSDAAIIATMAAAQDHPEHFRHDSVFNNPHAARFYVAFHVPLTRLLASLTGDYGSAFALILLPTLFLYLSGFYFLGYTLTAHRGFALAFAILNMLLIKGPRDTAWGPFKDALPRFDHAVLFAFLFALLWLWRNRPRLWILLFAFAGLGVFVHPVSTPALGAMICGAVIALSVCERALRQRAVVLLLCATTYLCAIAPFAYPFMLNSLNNAANSQVHRVALDTADADAQIARIVEERFTGSYLYPSDTVIAYLRRPLIAFVVIPQLLLGLYLIARFRPAHAHALIAMIVGAVVGLTLAAILIPVALEMTTSPLQAAEFKGELPRALRYIVPLSFLAGVIGLREAWRSLSLSRKRAAYGLAAISMIVVLLGVLPRAQRALIAMTTTDTRESCTRQLIAHLKSTRCCDSNILAVMSDPLVIRYAALRPLYFSLKDTPPRNSLSGAVHWQKNAQRMRALLEISDPNIKIAKAVEWAREVESRYVVVELRSIQNRYDNGFITEAEILFLNSMFVLIKVR